jgi:hypothetical protein
MKVKVIISESQKNRIIIESMGEQIKDELEEKKKLISRISKEASEQIKFDLSIMLTFSAPIAGFIGPLEDYLKGKHHELTSVELSLILSGIIFQYIKDNNEILRKIKKKIKDMGLTVYFRDALSKSEELKNSFLNFLESIGVSIQKTSNIMGFTFLIPIIPLLYHGIQNGSITPENIYEIVERIGLFMGANYGGTTLREILSLLIRKLRQ